MHNGDQDSALDGAPLLYLGAPFLPLLLHEIGPVHTRPTQSGSLPISRLSSHDSCGNKTSSTFLFPRVLPRTDDLMESWFIATQRWGMSRFIESYLKWKLPLMKHSLVPEHRFIEDYSSCQMAILPENFFSEADQGRIKFRKSAKWWFYETGVVLEDGSKLEADVILLATGYEGKKKLYSIVPRPFRDLLEDSNGVMPLCR